MRNVFLLTLTISVVALSGCRTTPGISSLLPPVDDNFDAERDRCKASAQATVNRHKPVVCIQFFSGGASVSPVITPASPKVGNHRNRIKFIAAAKELFDVEFEPDTSNPDCVASQKMRCTDECDFEVNENAPVGTLCKYSVVFSRTDGTRSLRIKLDPIVIIDTE